MTTNEENVLQELILKFPSLDGKVRVARERRIFAEVPLAEFPAIFAHAVHDLQFCILCTITGLDEGEAIAAIYHLARENGIILNIKTAVPKSNPVFKTVSTEFPAATLYERELEDLLGAKVEGLPAGRRYPLPDDWPVGQYPLRKDWKPAVAAPKEEVH
jgi:Ni,Fe-hydrogenase III component G